MQERRYEVKRYFGENTHVPKVIACKITNMIRVVVSARTLLLIGFRSIPPLLPVLCQVFVRASCSLTALYAAKLSSTSRLPPA